MPSNFSKGVIFALSAAALNATIGVLSKVLMSNGFTSSSVAVIKTILGCILLSIVLLFLKRPTSAAKWSQAAICAFLGIFVLFHFETSAYRHYAAAGVVVVLMASASISSIILGRLLLKDAITANATVGAALAISGIAVIFGADLQQGFTLEGAVLASIAGCGYGAFSVAMKKMGVSGGLHFTRQLLFFGSLYLLMPATADGFVIGELSSMAIAALLALAALPTILGFFCTTKAIEYLKPSQVQALELTEPLFAALLAFVALNEVPRESLYLGAALIIAGLCFSNELIRLGHKVPTRASQ
ncbi:EamA family transporter [Pseudomonas syringae]|uniref:DMT family transporter n=1 Tax=Pseudomonas syringae TaxID=317 RepID=UPI00028E8D1A|nr:EamA family transporter [Pseudomonas syringae]EKG43054.1 Permease of the drug/metabolite transporter (DMT) super family [Pseudomonas syringae pv. avellanae str. ISPaVe013]MDF7797224.1 EamA family transporter [Pseudomonas syringae]PIO92147.1 EamA family transporter [Pseudomonas syringae]POP73033.1 EamA family transporter [Pseudomonas syringae pv. syringae]POP77513.1 EamA family transporter [Pseudomonas syringae]